MAMRRAIMTLGPKRPWNTSAASTTTTTATARMNVNKQYDTRFRMYTATNPLNDLSNFYTIEMSNTDRSDATKITVRGPDMDGILASMTVALAQQGCSLKELHAGYANPTETSFHHQKTKHEEGDQIEDIFYVAQHKTGEAFEDDDLEDLAHALLSALNAPMRCISGKTVNPKELENKPEISKESQIKVIKKA